MGISVPYVNTAEEAREAVKRVKYPPLGVRGIAGSPRACGYGMNRGHYLQRANDENLVMIAIETPEGIKNLPEIMKIEDLDGIFIGPMDLSTSMGMMGQFDREVFKAAIRQTRISYCHRISFWLRWPMTRMLPRSCMIRAIIL